MKMLSVFLLVLAMSSAGVSVSAVAGHPALDAAGFEGGMIVRLDCRDAGTLAALAEGQGRLVHGLVRNGDLVQPMRQALVEKGIGGIATVAHWQGEALPYIDRSVTLIVAPGGKQQVASDEIARVLAPYGKMVKETDGKWQVTYTQPWPETIDSWTHYMHAPDNNVVSQDFEAGDPQHLQWIGEPRWSRHHDHLASVNAMVTEKGKLFYIIDEGSKYSILMPPDWKLVCRDAFNGVKIWERPISRWWPHLFPLKSGPANLPRRLVAVDDEVYAPQTVFDDVAAYDAATGGLLRIYKGSGNAEELLVVGDTLLVLTNPTQPGVTPTVGSFGPEREQNTKIYAGNRPSKSPITDHFWEHIKSPLWLDSDRTIRAYELKSGKKRWDYRSKVAPLTLAADGEKIYFNDSERIVAVDLQIGKKVFATDNVPIAKEFMMSFFGATLVIHDGVILFAGGEKLHQAWAGWGLGTEQGQDTMHAFDAKTGEKLWTAAHAYGGYQSPEDLIVAQGLVWVADTAVGGHEGTWKGHNIRTGEVEKEIPPTLKTRWFHHRCYRTKATERFIMPSRNGIELIDLEKKEWQINHWVRSACLYGIMPANGFIYNAPHNCACHPMAKLYGFNALAPATPTRAMLSNPQHPVEKGPVFGKVISDQSPVISSASSWPVFRGGNERAGAVKETIAPQLKRAWKVGLKGKITQPVVQGDLMVIASVPENSVHALSASTGKEKWRYVAGGRVDSPPTLAAGYCVFGSADGYVTALRCYDGALAWRFRAAPVDRRMFALGQLESVWRVYGSVLVHNGEVIFTAGRSMYLEGGALFFRIDLDTGKLLHKNVMTMVGEDGQELQAPGGLSTPPALTDVLSMKDDLLYIRQLPVDLEGNRVKTGAPHLFAPYGFTDDEWFHRGYWCYGTVYSGGHGGYPQGHKVGPAGRMIVFDDQNVYSYGRERKYLHWTTELEYYLFAATRQDKYTAPAPAPAAKAKAKGKGKSKGQPKYDVEKATQWSTKIPLAVRAMVKTGDVLYMAGPPDVLNEDIVFQEVHLASAEPVVEKQHAAYKGKLGSILYAVDAGTGEKLAAINLEEVPEFDGLIAANGNLYMSTTGGELICFEPAK